MKKLAIYLMTASLLMSGCTQLVTAPLSIAGTAVSTTASVAGTAVSTAL